MITIAHLAKQVGIPTKTIRFYEAVGLIPPPKRAANGYRLYDARASEKLKLIKYTRDLGLPIAEIKKLMEGCPDGDCAHTKQYLESEIGSYIRLLDEKIKQLAILKDRLNILQGTITIDKDCPDRAAYCCNILEQLVNIHQPKGGERYGLSMRRL